MKRGLLTACFFLSLQAVMHACSCVFLDFCALQEGDDLVAHVRVIESRPQSVRVDVLALFSGTVDSDVLTIESGDGANCVQTVHHLNIGQEMVARLQRTTANDFIISICGQNSLLVENGVVRGHITGPHVEEIPIDRFAELVPCIDGVLRPSSISVFPNPVPDQLSIEWINTPENAAFELVLFDVLGRTIYTDQAFVTASEVQTMLPMTDMPSGTYVLEVKGLAREWLFKIVKVDP